MDLLTAALFIAAVLAVGLVAILVSDRERTFRWRPRAFRRPRRPSSGPQSAEDIDPWKDPQWTLQRLENDIRKESRGPIM